MARLELKCKPAWDVPRLSSFHWRSGVGVRAKKWAGAVLLVSYSLSIGISVPKPSSDEKLCVWKRSQFHP